MDSSRVPIGSGQLTADPRRIRCHEPDIVQYIDFFSTLLGPDNRAPRFWEVGNAILTADGKTLEDWVGREEARRARDLINNASTVREQVVEARLQQSRRVFATSTSYATAEEKAQIRELASRGRLVQRTEFGRLGYRPPAPEAVRPVSIGGFNGFNMSAALS